MYDSFGNAEVIHSKIYGDGRVNKTNQHLLYEKIDAFIEK